MINFSLHVSPDNYSRYYNELCNHARSMADIIVPPPLPSPTPHGNVLHAPIPQKKDVTNGTQSSVNQSSSNGNGDSGMEVDDDSEPMARLKRSIDANREISRWQLPRGVGSHIRLLQYMHKHVYIHCKIKIVAIYINESIV